VFFHTLNSPQLFRETFSLGLTTSDSGGNRFEGQLEQTPLTTV